MLGLSMFQMQQQQQDTDCSFVFTCDDGSQQVIYAHKMILSSVSPYFKTNFKAEWNGDEPIPITSFTHAVFEKFTHAIYLSDVDFETLEEGCKLFEAAHFYQTEYVLDIVREKLHQKIEHCFYILNFSTFANTALKYLDFILMNDALVHFSSYAETILTDPDFLKFTPDAVNFLLQDSRIRVREETILKALEKYVNSHGSALIKVLKPAIGALRFLALSKKEIQETELLTEIEKNFLLGNNNNINIAYLSKNREERMETVQDPTFPPPFMMQSPPCLYSNFK